MSQFTNLAMQNRDAEAMRRKRRKSEIEDSLLSSGGSSSESSNYSGGFGDDSSFSSGGSPGALSSQDMLMYSAAGIVDIGIDWGAEKLWDKFMDKVEDRIQEEGKEKIEKEVGEKVTKEVGEKVAKEAGEELLKEGVEEAAEWGLKKLGKEALEKVVGYGAAAMTGPAAPFIVGAMVASDIYDAVDLVSVLTTGESLGEHIKDTLSGEEDEPEEWEEEHNTKGNTVSIKDAKKKAEEEKKKKEMEEAEKAKKLAEEKLKKEEENKNAQQQDEEEEEDDDEEDEIEDSEYSGTSATKRGLIKGLTHTLGTAGGTMAVSLSMIGIYKVHYTGEFEYKGISAEYQSSNYTFQNFVDYDDNGDVILKGLTKENKLMKTFYTKYSDKSYYAIVEDSKKYGSNMDDAYLKKNLLTPDELREQYPDIQDVNNREAMFQINPDVLYVLDKYIHEDEVLYPQQFVKPLYYEESQANFGLKDLVSEKGEILAKSQVFNADGSPAKDSNGKFKTTPGIWDYGFASILRYKEYEVPRRKITTPVKREVKEVSKDVITSEGDVLVEELVSGAIPGASNVTQNISNRPEPAYIIDTAVTPGGTVTNEIEQKWQRNSDPATPSTKSFRFSVKTGEKKICTANNPNDSGAAPSQSGSDKSDTASSKPEDISTRETTTENGETCTVVPTYTVYQVTDHYETYIEEELPQYVGEPSSEGISGSEYFRDYMSSYSNYYPSGLPSRIDFTVLENEEIQSLIYDDDPAMFGMGGVVNNNASTVTKEEFQKAVFMGDSITNGLKNYNAVPGDRVYAQDGNQVITGDKNFSDKILAAKPPVIIIGYGTNDAGNINNLDNFTKNYKILIKKFQDGIPGVKIFLNKIFPGDESKATSSHYKTIIKNIPEFNKALSQIASETNVTLIDCTGIPNLKSYYEPDGIHFKSNFYSLWLAEMEKQIVGTNAQSANTSIVSKTSQEYSNYTQMQSRTPSQSVGAIDIASFFGIGSKKDSEVVVNGMQYLPLFEKYGNRYGVDPYLLIAMAAQESRGLHNPNGWPAVGIMQIEKPGNVIKSITAYNFETGAEETMQIPNASAVASAENNIRAGAMQLASRLKTWEYNPVVSLQSYNLGSGGLKYTMSYYLGGGTKAGADSVYSNNTQIMDYVKLNDLSWITTEFPGDLPVESDSSWGKNPNNGTHEARTWYKQTGHYKFEDAGGGDPAYLEHVLRYYAGPDKPWIKKPDGSVITIDGSATSASGGYGGGTPAQFFNSYLNSNWSSILDKWDLLFPGQNELDKKLDLVKKGDYTQLAANYQARERNGARSSAITIPRTVNKASASMNKVDTQLALNMMFALNQSNYLFKYDNMNEAEWKAMYTQLLSSPTGQTWDDKWIGFTVEDIFGVKTIDDLGTLFPTDIGVTPSISVPYGMIKNNISDDETKMTQYNVMNFGIDIVVPPDTDVLTVADGTVVSISKKNDINSKYGNYVKIQHAKGTTTLTANLKTVKVKVGDKLKLGDVIGTSGGDCKSYKDNAIFYQIINNGTLINPTWVITREMTGFEDPISGNNGVICGGNASSSSPTVSVAYVETAKQQTDKPYVYGTAGPNSFDCSGLVYWSMKQHGIDIPRDSRSQRKATTRINYEELQVGDLIFRHGPSGTDIGDVNDPEAVEHVMIYLGNNQVLHASSPSRGILIEEFKRRANHSFGRYSQALGGSTVTSGAASGCQTGGSLGGTDGYLWPVPDTGRVTSVYGPRWCQTHGWEIHRGIDISKGAGLSEGLPIVASKAGTVIFSGPSGDYGNLVKIDHGDGTETRYAHNSKNLVKVGDTVSQGQHIANVGNTGSSYGAHLHYEIRINGEAIDPLDKVQKPADFVIDE